MIQAVIKGAYNLLVGMGVTFKNMLSKPVTFQYPEHKRVMPDRYRGRHFLNRDDEGLEKCIGCSLCSINCPVNCIHVVSAENDPNNPVSKGERYAEVYEINLSALHLLRVLRGGVSGGRGGPAGALRARRLRSENIYCDQGRSFGLSRAERVQREFSGQHENREQKITLNFLFHQWDQETAVSHSAGSNIQRFRKNLAEPDGVGVFAFKAGVMPGVERESELMMEFLDQLWSFNLDRETVYRLVSAEPGVHYRHDGDFGQPRSHPVRFSHLQRSLPDR